MILKLSKILIPIFLIVIIGWNLYPKNTELETKKQLEEIKNQAEEASAKSNQDLDNDGLLNWEEELYKTDLENPDTDNDGMSDKEEIESNRSPVVFGTGLTDDLKDLVSQKNLVQASLNVPENLEDVKVSGRIDSLSDFLEKAGYSNENGSWEESQTQVQIETKNYFNKVADQILLAAENAGTLNESLYALYEGNANSLDRQALSSLATRYKTIGQSLASISTPKFVKEGLSKELSKKYIDLADSLGNLVKATGAYGDNDFKSKADLYTKNVTTRNTAFVDIHNYVIKEKIYFSQSDSGRFFLFEIGEGL